jgi:hypothetical protein
MTKQILLPRTFEFSEIKGNYIPLLDILNNLPFDAQVEIIIRKIKKAKTHRQLKGFHRLLKLIADYCRDQTGDYWDVEDAKQLIKHQYKYYKTKGDAVIYLSCAKATKEDLMGLIKTAEKFGSEFNIPECYITSEEEREFNNFYKVTE